MTPDALDAAALEFLTERHLATLSVPRRDGSVQVTPVGMTWSDDGIARVIARGTSAKARRIDAEPGLRVTVCQVDGGRWLALEGPAAVTRDAERVAFAVERYAARYRQPEPNPERIAIEIAVDRVTGRW
jgi:PPOX class probable F420-dependent enzyme